MDIKAVASQLIAEEQTKPQDIERISANLVNQIRESALKIIEIVRDLDSVLTNSSHAIRCKGVEILSHVVTALPKDALMTKEIEVLSEFLCLKLVDHKSMEKPTLLALSHFIDCDNKPNRYSKKILEFLKEKVNIKRMEARNRRYVYDLVKRIVLERRKKTNVADGELIYAIVHIFDEENNPENLMVCFGTVLYIFKNFQELDPYADELFEWLAAYYPIDYTPSDEQAAEDVQSLGRSVLVESFYDCFFASPLNADNLQTLLLEKLDSNVMSTKLESLELLIRCYEEFPLPSIKSYTSSLWTAIRMECLKKADLVNPKLLDLSYKALTAMTNKLAEDDESYFIYISDMYEELSIAFRKPEMDLFEPAARLLAHAIMPKLKGFNFVLGKIAPICLKALADFELRPIAGFAYILSRLSLAHPNSKLDSEAIDKINELTMKICDSPDMNRNFIDFIQAILCCKIELSKDLQDILVEKLLTTIQRDPKSHEQCLALLCIKYHRADILFGSIENDLQIKSLVKSISHYTKQKSTQNTDSSDKFSIYLRLLIIKLDAAKASDLDSVDAKDIGDFLSDLRESLATMKDKPDIIEKASIIHAIITNKLDSKRVEPILMEFFSSPYCQRLAPSDQNEADLSKEVYVPMIKFVMKSLVIRNHPLSLPLVNLVLNFITSDKLADQSLSTLGANIFSFILSDEGPLQFDKNCSYQVFSLYKQKFYVQSMNEIKIRYEAQEDTLKKNLLIASAAVQIPHLSPAIYRKDHEMLLRALLKMLSISANSDKVDLSDDLLHIMFECVEKLVQNAPEKNVSSFLTSLVNLSLKYAQHSESLRVRQRALSCLARLTSSVDDSELLNLRSSVVDQLRPSLADKKRLVRQAAAEARLRWVLVGQPTGS